VSDKRAANESQDQDGKGGSQEVPTKGLQNELAAVRAAADLQDRTIGKRLSGQSEIALFIFRNADPHNPARKSESQHRRLKLNPIFRRSQKEHIPKAPDDPYEKRLFLLCLAA